MPFLDRARHWGAANLVPVVLIPLALGLIWVAVWRIWLPTPSEGSITARTVTTVNANATRLPTHKVTTVVRTARGASPSRRSEVLALALIILGTGAVVIGLFHNRIASLELDKDGVKIDLSAAERSGAAVLVSRLAGVGAAPGSYAAGLDRYLRGIAARRPEQIALGSAGGAGIGTDQAETLADRIADELV
jgi:hypothetical protein